MISIHETKLISTRKGNRAENPPTIGGSLQVDGATQIKIFGEAPPHSKAS